MKQPTPAVRNFAGLLLELAAAQNVLADEPADAALRVLEKLDLSLSRLVGLAGYQALLARALALSTKEAGWLGAVRVHADATLDGFREAARRQPAEAVAEGSKVLLAQLLGLLVTFIGTAITFRLVAELWPEAQLIDVNMDAEETRHE